MSTATIEPTEAQVAWLAGILEGEASFSLYQSPSKKWPDACITLAMTDEDVIGQVSEWFGGNMRGPYLPPSAKEKGRKPTWVWSVGAQKDVYRILNLIRPWMKARRCARIDEILNFLELKKPFPESRGKHMRRKKDSD